MKRIGTITVILLSLIPFSLGCEPSGVLQEFPNNTLPVPSTPQATQPNEIKEESTTEPSASIVNQESQENSGMTVSSGPIGITIGEPSCEATIDSEGYPHKAESFELWGGTARREDVNGNLIPISSGTVLAQDLVILNGHDYARVFHLLIQATGSLRSDRWGEFEALPIECLEWINIEDIEPKVPIGGTKKILVTVSVPNKLPKELRGGKYWFGIQVEDWSQTGFIQIAPKMNWLLTFEE